MGRKKPWGHFLLQPKRLQMPSKKILNLLKPPQIIFLEGVWSSRARSNVFESHFVSACEAESRLVHTLVRLRISNPSPKRPPATSKALTFSALLCCASLLRL